MELLVDKKYVKDVIIITPKRDDDGKILYFHFNIENEFDINSEYIEPEQTIIEDGMWYKYISECGQRYAHLLCKDDCLIIEYKIENIDNKVDCNTLIVHYRNYNNKSNCSITTETYENYSRIYETKYETLDYIFWTNRNSVYYIEFIEFIKYYLQKYPVQFYKEPIYSYYELSREYYENRNKIEQTTKYGYGIYELNTIFLELFPEIMSEENYNAYYDLQVYNKTYVPKEYYHIDDKLKEDLRNENND